MRNDILLFVNGQSYRVTGKDALLTLSDYLRLRLKLCGTKIVCAEGDCGSCSVLCGRILPNSSTVEYWAIDSCIRFVFQLDGCHIITVEGLMGPTATPARLNGVQQAMIDCHGSQCGFCTPGFVVAMTGVLESNENPSTEQWRSELTGNLCRCTGYSPIIAAGEKSNHETTPPLNSIYPASELVTAAAGVVDLPIQIEVDNDTQQQLLFCPTQLSEATDFLAEHPDARIVAGATDIGVQHNKGRLEFETLLDLNRVDELTRFEFDGDVLVAGARVTWKQLEDFTRSAAPAFHEIVSIFGSPQIRHVGTLGGNIINASPIADSLPFLFVCEAELELQNRGGTRHVPINDFYKGYKEFDLKPGELLTQIKIPLTQGRQLRLYKVSRRRDLDISTFTAAIAMQIENGTIEMASLAYGAVGPVVLRLPETEAFLIGRPFDLETMRAAGDFAIKEITPITDVRGGEDFRNQLARNVLQKFYHEINRSGVTV